jgi:hypothetical protein
VAQCGASASEAGQPKEPDESAPLFVAPEPAASSTAAIEVEDNPFEVSSKPNATVETNDDKPVEAPVVDVVEAPKTETPAVATEAGKPVEKAAAPAVPAAATASKTEIPQPTFTLDGDKTKRESADQPEMEDVYVEAPQVEGWSGWKNNSVRRSELINNNLIPIADRWRVGMPNNTLRVKNGGILNPYRQNMIKGDYPIIGQSIFLSVLGISDTLVEGHSVPTPAGVNTNRRNSEDFFGRPDQFVLQQNFILSMELFKGETEFKPREWEVRVTPVFNLNYVDVQERFVVNIDPRKGTDRLDHQIAFQELFGEYHFRDISPNYDFISSRTGIQFYNEDFRGFLFCDNNLGLRVFGNLESNRLQYNLVGMEMLDKDSNSGLNKTFEFKDEHVLLANLIRQDTFIKGYNMIFNLGFSDEEESKQYTSNGVIVRPAPIGSLRAHSIKTGYVGFGGDGHIGRVNITHQFYQALGKDSENPLAGKEQDINARMFALELSYDVDWMRFRTSYFYASGDKDAYDSTAGGFDAIFDNPNFAGGQFSYWGRQGFGAGNALTSLKSRGSLLPNLATSKEEGQSNFVNPGIQIFNLGYDAELTPRLKAVLNFNYLKFDNTSSLETLLQQDGIHKNLGLDYSMGLIYRPFLSQNVVLTGGVAGFTPLEGFRDVYSTSKTLYQGFLGITVRY